MNTESTVAERLRMVIGAILTTIGFGMFTFGGLLTRFSDATWIIGIALTILGYLIARSMKVIEIIS